MTQIEDYSGTLKEKLFLISHLHNIKYILKIKVGNVNNTYTLSLSRSLTFAKVLITGDKRHLLFISASTTYASHDLHLTALHYCFSCAMHGYLRSLLQYSLA